MPYKLTAWREENPVTEDEIRKRLTAEGLTPTAWSKNPGETQEEQEHPQHTVVYCVKGMIRFNFPAENDYADLMPGDRLDLPPGTNHGTMIGPAGVTCLEAQK